MTSTSARLPFTDLERHRLPKPRMVLRHRPAGHGFARYSP
jgi:hypothetical protein